MRPSRVSSVALDPHVVLAAAAAIELACEYLRAERGSTTYTIAGALLGTLALLYAWRCQDRLRASWIVLLAIGFYLAWALLDASLQYHHLAGRVGDTDAAQVFTAYGDSFKAGDYPKADYPPGAVTVFGLEAILSGGKSTQGWNTAFMFPFQILSVIAVLLVRSPTSRWLAAAIAICPTTYFEWQYGFDAVPAALLVIALLLAVRERWVWSGVAFGLGTVVKWTPAFGMVVLVVWFLSRRRVRDAATLFVSSAVTFVAINIPFLVWSPHNVLAAYQLQGSRHVTDESVYYWIMRPLGYVHQTKTMWAQAHAPRWVDFATVVVQVLVLVALLWAVRRPHVGLTGAVVGAALAPVLFLLFNRVFSPGYMLEIGAAWFVAAALVIRDRRTQLWVGLLFLLANGANLFVYPLPLPHYVFKWQEPSALAIVCELVATAIVARAGLGLARPRGVAAQAVPTTP